LLESEIRVLSETSHPKIIRIFAMYEDNLNVYIISELMTGGTLLDYIVKTKMFSELKAS